MSRASDGEPRRFLDDEVFVLLDFVVVNLGCE
jgi:hypothetical protein